MARDLSDIFTYEADSGTIGTMSIDGDGYLYWNGKIVLTEKKVTFDWWVNGAVILGGLSTTIIALFSTLSYVSAN